VPTECGRRWRPRRSASHGSASASPCSAAQKAQAADSFSAEAKFLSAAKKLLDTQHPAYQAVTAVRGQIVQHWKSLTLPYPEPGLRLIRQDDLAPFDQQLGRFREDLQSAVCALEPVIDLFVGCC